MSKLLYLFLVWIVSICTLDKCIEGQNTTFKLSYNFTDYQNATLNGYNVDFIKQEKNVIILSVQKIAKNLFIFKIPLKNLSDNSGYRHSTLLKFSNNNEKMNNIRIPNGLGPPIMLKQFDKKVECNLIYCRIGAFYYKTTDQFFDLEQNSHFDGIFFVTYEATEEYKYLFLMYLSSINDIEGLDVVVCPHETWISKHSLSEYIVDENDIIPFPKKNAINGKWFYYKINHNQDSNPEKFVKCGSINQKFMPSIDVGYVWGSKPRKDISSNSNDFIFFSINTTNIFFNLTNGLLSSLAGDISGNSFIAYQVLSPDNNYNSKTTIIGRYKNDSKLYSGQKIFLLNFIDKEELTFNVKDTETGYYFHFKPQLLVPNIETTLRLKVNGVVQKIKTANNSEIMDTYTVNLEGMNNSPVGCHAVPDNSTHPKFEDFYEKRYQTDLSIFDTNTNTYIMVKDTKSLVANSTYKCALYDRTTNYKNLTEKYIKETKFTIHLIRSLNSNEVNNPNVSNDSTKSNSTIWIIVGVSVGAVLLIVLLLLAGLIFYRKRLQKKKESKNSLSSKKSQPISKSSSVIENDFNVSMIQKKSYQS